MKLVHELKTNEITLTFPLKTNLIIIPRLIISAILSNEQINIEEIENTKLIISEAINLLIEENNIKPATIKFNTQKEENFLIIKLSITTDLTTSTIENLSKNGLTIHILNYLCSKFYIKKTTNQIQIFLEKEIPLC